MKLLQRAAVLSAAGLLLFSAAACGGKGKNFAEHAPYYGGGTVGTMDMYAYSSPTDGTYMVDGKAYFTQDNRTVERYKEYKEAGFNVLFLQANDPYGGEDFETSQLKKNMDNAVAAGIDKVIVCDSRLLACCKNEPIVGEGRDFGTQEDLEAFVSDCIADYKHHSAFYGVMLLDEPTWEYFDSMGSLIRAIHAAEPDAFVQSNLRPGPHDAIKAGYSENAVTQTVTEAFESYIDVYMEKTQARQLMNDIYPFVHSRPDTENMFIISHYFQNMQISAEKARQYGADFHHITTSTSMYTGSDLYIRYLDKSLVYYETNTALGFGVKSLAYFTYWRKQQNKTTGEFFPEDGAMIAQDGTQTPLYGYIRDVNSEIHAFAPVILNFDYQGARSYVGAPLSFPLAALGGIKQDSFTALSDLSVSSGDAALVTELKDADGNYMYMVQNVLDPANNAKGDTVLDFTATFEGFDYAAVYYKGKPEYVKLGKKGEFSAKLAAGYADFIIPFNA